MNYLLDRSRQLIPATLMDCPTLSLPSRELLRLLILDDLLHFPNLFSVNMNAGSHQIRVFTYGTTQVIKHLLGHYKVFFYGQKQVAQSLLDLLWSFGNVHNIFQNPSRCLAI